MKKLCFLILVLMTLTACGKINKDESSIEKNTKEVEVETIMDEELSSQEIEETNLTTEEYMTEEKERSNTNFRNAYWGDDIATVKKYETAEYVDGTDDNLIYKTVLLGAKVYAVYTFDEEKLIQGTYILEEEFTNGGQYISHYNSVKEGLIEKYGEPKEDEYQKYETDDQIELAGPARALEYGYTSYHAIWENEETRITVGLASQNFDIAYPINYQDISTLNEDDKNNGL